MKAIATDGSESFATGTRIFVGTVAVSNAVAFGSIWIQWRGLIGPSGILPASQFLAAARGQLGARAFYDVPTLCWMFGTGRFIEVLCLLGIGLSLLLLLGYAPALCLTLIWVFHLSLVSVGQIFFDFQWDVLLLESTLIAIWLVPWTLGRTAGPHDPPRLARYLAWWLLFRLMFLSGIVKLTSGDPTWRNLTALAFHYQTQPLPSPLAWYFQQLPIGFQKVSCAVMFAIELLGPLCIPGPRAVRNAAVVALMGLQVLIALTGNYAYFNLLSIGLCLACLDDAWWRCMGWKASGLGGAPATQPWPTLLRWFAALSVGVTFFEATAAVNRSAGNSPLVRAVESIVGPFRSFNDYGLFRVMTTERPELVFEGSNDGNDWREYGLPFKPGDLARRPRWVAPYQPRLDWQLWFAALDTSDNNPWVGTVCARMLENDRDVLDLFSVNPFPDRAPRLVRVVRYEYEFTNFAERASTGNWWRRTPIDFYIPAVSLPENAR